MDWRKGNHGCGVEENGVCLCCLLDSRIRGAVIEKIKSKWPERMLEATNSYGDGNYSVLSVFNDHPLTTLEEVMEVLNV